MQSLNQESNKELRRKLRKSMTKAEVIMWSKLRNKRLNGIKFRRQHSFGRYIVDFYCHSLKLVIEIDGDSHVGEHAEGYDQIRQREIESQGIKVIRFTNNDVYNNLEGVIESIMNATSPSPS